jgi:hypothetical protein
VRGVSATARTDARNGERPHPVLSRERQHTLVTAFEEPLLAQMTACPSGSHSVDDESCLEVMSTRDLGVPYGARAYPIAFLEQAGTLSETLGAARIKIGVDSAHSLVRTFRGATQLHEDSPLLSIERC